MGGRNRESLDRLRVGQHDVDVTEQARDLDELAATMFAEVLRDGQSARNLPDTHADAEPLRSRLRALGRRVFGCARR